MIAWGPLFCFNSRATGTNQRAAQINLIFLAHGVVVMMKSAWILPAFDPHPDLLVTGLLRRSQGGDRVLSSACQTDAKQKHKNVFSFHLVACRRVRDMRTKEKGAVFV